MPTAGAPASSITRRGSPAAASSVRSDSRCQRPALSMPISTGSKRVAVERRQHVARRQQRDLVLRRAAAEQDDDARLLHLIVLVDLELGEHERPFVDQLRDHLAERLARAVAGVALEAQQHRACRLAVAPPAGAPSSCARASHRRACPTRPCAAARRDTRRRRARGDRANTPTASGRPPGLRASRIRGSRGRQCGSDDSGACRAAARRKRRRGTGPAAASAPRPPAGRRSSAPRSRAGAALVTRFAISHSAAATKSSNTFCLRLEHAGAVPVLAVFAAAAQHGQRVGAARLQERDRRRRPGRQHAVVEAAVAGQQRGLLAVALDRPCGGRGTAAAACRRATSPSRVRPRTPAESIGVCSRRHDAEAGASAAGHVDAKHLGRDEERREPVADLGDVARAGQRRQRAEPGQRDVAARRPVGRDTAAGAAPRPAATRPRARRGSRRPLCSTSSDCLTSSRQRARSGRAGSTAKSRRAARRWS